MFNDDLALKYLYNIKVCHDKEEPWKLKYENICYSSIISRESFEFINEINGSYTGILCSCGVYQYTIANINQQKQLRKKQKVEYQRCYNCGSGYHTNCSNDCLLCNDELSVYFYKLTIFVTIFCFWKKNHSAIVYAKRNKKMKKYEKIELFCQIHLINSTHRKLI